MTMTMSTINHSINLTGHFLIAMPGMVDARFAGTLTYLCRHDAEGALGIVVNRPIGMQMADLFAQTGVMSQDVALSNYPLFFGGPVETGRGFVLHQPLGSWQSTLSAGQDIGLTTSRDIIDALAQGDGPKRMMVALGYAGWSTGQLEHELAQNAWLSVAAQPEVIFDTPIDGRLNAAAHLLGIDYLDLPEEAGHA